MMRLATFLTVILMMGCEPKPETASPRPSWMQEPPSALTEEFYRSHTRIEDVDTGMWTYLCNLIPEDERPYRARRAAMMKSVSSELRRYYLVRGFDWERGSGGLESCFMGEPGDELFLDDTSKAFESLGAFTHAAIVRELIPRARDRGRQINEAGANGVEFNFDDGFWYPYELRWEAASREFNFYDIIWMDIRSHPEQYTHRR